MWCNQETGFDLGCIFAGGMSTVMRVLQAAVVFQLKVHWSEVLSWEGELIVVCEIQFLLCCVSL
jgi:hypothetical protein